MLYRFHPRACCISRYSYCSSHAASGHLSIVTGLAFLFMQLIWSKRLSPHLNILMAPLSHCKKSALSKRQLKVAIYVSMPSFPIMRFLSCARAVSFDEVKVNASLKS